MVVPQSLKVGRYRDTKIQSSHLESKLSVLWNIHCEARMVYRVFHFGFWFPQTSLVLTDLAKKEKKYLRKKYRLYHWSGFFFFINSKQCLFLVGSELYSCVMWNIALLYSFLNQSVYGRCSGPMLSALDSGLSDPGPSPGQGHCVVFLVKTLNSHSASFHPGL